MDFLSAVLVFSCNQISVHVSAPPPAKKTASLIEKETFFMKFHTSAALAASVQSDRKETLEKRISNTIERMTKEGILTILQKDRAQRFNPSKFVIRYSAVLRFAFQNRYSYRNPKITHMHTVVNVVSYERRLWSQVSSLIGKETLKKRMTNDE